MTRSEQAPEAGSRWLSREIGGGHPQKSRAVRESKRLVGSTLSAEGAPGWSKPSSLTGERWSRFWCPARGLGFRVLAGYDMKRQRRLSPTLRAVDKAVAREHRPERCSAPLGNEWRAVSGGAEARCAPSSAPRSGAALPQGSSALVPRMSAEVHPRGWLAVARGCRSVTAKASRPGNRTTTGARVVCRLQKSVRSIFPSFDSRQAARQTTTARGSSVRTVHSFDEGSLSCRTKGCGAMRANEQVNAHMLHSTARSSIEPTEGVLSPRRHAC